MVCTVKALSRSRTIYLKLMPRGFMSIDGCTGSSKAGPSVIHAIIRMKFFRIALMFFCGAADVLMLMPRNIMFCKLC